LYAAMNKLSQLLSVSPEPVVDTDGIESWHASVEFVGATVATDRGEMVYNFALPTGSTAMLVARSSIQESSLGDLLRGYVRPASGQILLGEHDVEDFAVHRLRDEVFVVDASPLPVCSIEDYLRLANPQLTRAEMRALLDTVGLNIDQPGISRALGETLSPEGYPLSTVGMLKLKIAFALASSSKIIILTSQFDTFSQEARIKILNHLKADTSITVICFTHRQDIEVFDKFIYCDFTEQMDHDSAASVINAYVQNINGSPVESAPS
ncbi:MAG: hypothetical protein AAF387_21640, partial [Pseudomonadota bacterium]